MQLADTIVSQFACQVTFPLSNYLMNRRDILRIGRELIMTESLDAQALERLQLDRMRRVLSYAQQWIPFYQQRFKEVGFDARDFQRLEELRQIPPLTREEVIEHHREMVDRRYRNSIDAADRRAGDAGAPGLMARFSHRRLVRNNSSGSTGAPTVFYEDGSISAQNWALEQRLKRWFGVAPGEREARMVRLSTQFVCNDRKNRWRQRLWRQMILPGVNMQNEDYEFCIHRLAGFRPTVLWGFTGSLTGLAEYLRDSGRRLGFSPKVAIGWAAPLYDHEKELLEAIFDCPASNLYGSREVGHIAVKCPARRFHVNQETHYVETVPSDEVPTAGVGELLVTTLTPTPMPFIRYRMGDLGSLAPTQCTCGRSLQVLEEFVGRTGEIFHTRDGRMIPPNFWCRLFMHRKIPGAVSRFQVCYRTDRSILLQIVKGPQFSAATETYLREQLTANFSPATPFEIQYAPRIRPTTSGKYLMVFSEPPEEGSPG